MIPRGVILAAVMMLGGLPVGAELPALPERPGESRLSRLERVRVERFELEGGTVFTPGNLQTLLEPFAGRELAAEELHDARDTIARHYVDHGYVNSGAVLPDQDVVGGVVRLVIVEGTLGDVEVKSEGRLRDAYIVGHLQSEGPLNVNRLRERLRLLEQSRPVARVDAAVRAGAAAGEARLEVEVEEQKSYDFHLTYDNHRSANIGEDRFHVEAAHHNLLGWGDRLFARQALNGGLRNHQFSYAVPLIGPDTEAWIEFERSNSGVIAAPFRVLDIESEYQRQTAGLRHALVRTLDEEIALDATLETRHTESRLLGIAFSFSPGVRNGESDVTVAGLAGEWSRRAPGRVVAARTGLEVGIDALGATVNDDAPDGRYVVWLGQAQWLERLDWLDSAVLFRAAGQVASDSLLPSAKFEIGGAGTVRGYPEGLLLRDTGVVSSLEWRVPVPQWPGIAKALNETRLELAAFVDAGTGRQRDAATPSPRGIASVGAGLRFAGWNRASAELYWGHALVDFPEPQTDTLQDSGLHFRVEVRAF